MKMSKWGDRLKKVEELAQSFQKNPLTTPYKPRLWPCQPSSVWKLFPRQSMAISFAQSCKEVHKTFYFNVSILYVEGKLLNFVPFILKGVHVFALEKEKESMGQRIYLVTSYSELWFYYR